MNCAMSVHLGVFTLGTADTAERALVEPHLSTCADCRAELAVLEPLPRLLARVPLSLVTQDSLLAGLSGAAAADGRSAPAGPTVGAGRSFLARVRAGVRWTRGGRVLRWRPLAVTAAAAAAVGAPGGFWLAQPGPSPAPAAITLTGANPVTHVRVTLALTGTSWGTSIQLVAQSLPLNVPCRLIVASRTGGTEVTGVWDAWSAGSVTVPASAGLPLADIASLRVATSSRNLVTVTVRRAAAPARAASHPTAPALGSRR
jgi:hypothetical protein